MGDGLAHGLTRHHAPVLELHERAARLGDRVLDPVDRDPQRDRDLVVRQTAQLAHQQNASLALAQLLKVRHEQREPRPLASLMLGRRRTRLVGVAGFANGHASANERDGLVVGDPKQPRTQRRVAPTVLQRGQRTRQGRLQRVVGVVVVTQNGAAVAVQRWWWRA